MTSLQSSVVSFGAESGKGEQLLWCKSPLEDDAGQGFLL